MFLKRLETIGFKSFAERITIEFVPGITTIVGPNGSGKSNIIDAIRWVLGEQSARSLRGQRMEDIIFQGSDTRNPLNFAEVSLILNNEAGELPIEYQEVKVTRRVYRSGESEFLINKQACRLKDIVDLFTDTGLGRESFSIIGQGKIDEILSSKADERRAIFEEAAGVMRYKRRKEEAAFKLTETEDNLSRVEDIIHEISQQIEPLKEQAKVAKQYKTYQKELTEKAIALLVTEIEQLHAEWSHLLKTIEVEKMQHIEQQTKLQQFEARIVKKREHSEHLETKVNSLQKRLLNITEQIEQSEGKRNVLIEQQKHREENKNNLMKEAEGLQDELAETKNKIAKEKDQLRKVSDTLHELQEEMAAVEAKLYTRHDEISEELEELKSDYIERLNDKAVLKNETKALRERKSRIEHALSQHEAKHSHLTEQAESIAEKKAQCKVALTDEKQRITEKKQTLNNLNQSLTEDEVKLESGKNNWYELNDEITKLSSRKEMLVEMKKNFQGFAIGVKEILQASKRKELNNIIGPVIDLIDVPANYMTAIDTVLGAQAQNVVVPDDRTARITIAWLKKEGKGRATFLPLQSIVSRYLPSNVRAQIEQEQGFIGIASELVNVKPEHQRVVEHLMGNVIVTERLQDANNIARKTNRRFRIVTLDGDVVFPGGSISGGAQRKRNYSLFTREREIEQLTSQLEKLKKERALLKETLTERHELIRETKQKVTRLTKQLASIQNDYQQLVNKRREYEYKGQALEDQLVSYRYQRQEYIEETEAINKQLSENEVSLRNLTEKINNIEQTIETKTAEQKTLQLDKQKNEQKLHELQLENAEYQERYKHDEKRFAALNDTYSSLKQKLTEVNEHLAQIVSYEKQQETISSVEQHIYSYRHDREQIVKMIEQLQKERRQLIQTIEDETRELKSQQKLHEQFATSLQEKEIEAGRLDVTLENRLQTLQKEYSMTYEKAANTYEKVTNVKAVTERVNELKRKISSLGTVNLGAIEEYDRLSERELFLNEQRDDLLDAKETLYDAIQKMDEEMITRFKATFESIQEAFTVVFKQLFGGGYAKLQLTDPDNYLETGVDIIARPPGKKLKTLELLSGGERALTAIALLFAILRARPVPFVILDEVDAALDEANVERFATYLKNFSEDSQFVVISHRKGTMEEADALYGVTMQESGVSRFVSVRLEEADDLVTSS